MIETIFSYLNPDLYHRFFFFLGTQHGTLFERSIELVIFTILAYMVISEYLRTRTKELKYFVFAFGSFMFLRFLGVIVNFSIAFGDIDSQQLNFIIPVASQFIEMFTLVLLINAFLYPIFSKKTKRLDQWIQLEIFGILGICIIAQIIWLIYPGDYLTHPLRLFFILLKIILIIYTLFILLRFSNIRFKYRRNVYIAFVFYLVTPMLQLMSLLVFSGLAPRLKLMEFPFPLIAILLFTRIIFLKLVDKAYLKRQLEESRQRYLHEKELSKMKDEFVSVVSHELRTPITSMKLYCNLIHTQKFGRMTEKQHQAIHIIESELDRLNNLINDILNLSKLEAGKTEMHPEKFNVKIFKDLIVNTTAKQKNIKVRYNIPDLTIYADKEKLEQVYINLFNNAVKFTPEKGRIEITISEDDSRWHLKIKDNGKGIPSDEIPKLFDKFYQVESHMTRSVRGTGLGLAIVKSIVDLHNGIIQIKSELNKGSEFRISFPKERKKFSS